METKMTAIEWLKDNLEQYGSSSRLDLDWKTLDELIEQAKEMEKEQKIEFANNYGFDICGYDYERAEQYYKETYGK